MSSINTKDFLDELIFCLKEEDIVKAKALLQFASDSSISPAVQRKAVNELAKGPERVVSPSFSSTKSLWVVIMRTGNL